jgi:oligoribonuclease NrnB/cAMP/cGMP phosphodiesterase (DHH superfamily)
MDLIISHQKCPDGWAAAYIAKKRYPEAEILLLDHGTPVPFEQVAGKDVIVLDFSWPNREDNIRLHDSAKSFHIFDHHKSALERIGDLPFVTFDMTRSGAGLAWDYLFGKDKGLMWYGEKIAEASFFQTRPWFINYIEDRDLWRFEQPNSKAVSAYLMSLPMTIEAWREVEIMKVEHAEQYGTAILRHVERYVSEAVQEAQRGFIAVGPTKYLTIEAVNCPYMNCSEVGNVLAKRADVGMTWFERADGQIQFSLRSEGEIDVSEIAKSFQGGGHKHAAGFRMDRWHGRILLDQILGRLNGG